MLSVSPLRSLKGCRVLVVEDEMQIAMATEDALTEAGCHVVGPVAQLLKALRMIEDNEPLDGAVIDMNLAGVSSLPIAEALSRLNVPFLILTGYGQIDLPSNCHPSRILSKPVDPDELVMHLADAVKGKIAA